VTVHLVTSELDNGPIILQATVPLLDDDTVETLSADPRRGTSPLIPKPSELVLGGGWSLAGRRFARRQDRRSS
jgi:phosphoribosylglycinamide formyltransferase-1